MSLSDWTAWRLPDWNAALVKAVFLDPTQSSRPLQRITASGRFLARMVGADDAASENVKSVFLSAFGSTASQIAHHFQWTTEKQRSLTVGVPNFFAALYLTLLAGSADEDTCSVGKFRVRFATLLRDSGFTEHFPFNDLPRMWEELEKWSYRQAGNNGVQRPLKLPDPKTERLIGYSKRLAFPTFNDERQLSKVLSETFKADDFSPEDVQAKVAGLLARFSASFQEEFQEFATQYSRGKRGDALETPFWGAVQDIAWDIECSISKKNGRYELVIDVADHFEPWLTVCADSVGLERLKGDCYPDGFASFSNLYHQIKPNDGGIWTFARLRSLVAKNKAFLSSKLGRAISSRQVIALPDDAGLLRVGGAFFDGCRVVCLIEPKRAERLFSIAKERRYQITLTKVGEASNDHAILVFSNLDRDRVKRLKSLTGDPVFDALTRSRTVSGLSLSGGAWLGQLLLLNPASALIARADDSTAGRFEFLGRNGEELLSGDLEADEEGAFRIPPFLASDVSEPNALRLVLSRSDGKQFEKQIQGLAVLRERPYTGIRDRSRWRIGGPGGSLCDLSPERFSADDVTNRVQEGNGAYTLPKEVVDCMAFCPVGANPAETVLPLPLDHLHMAVRWLWDALALRYQYRQALSYKEIFAHAEPAALAGATSPHQLIRLLEASGWIIRLSHRAYRTSSFVPAPLEVVVLSESEMPTARLIGPISSSIAENASSYIKDGEEFGMLLADDNSLSCGAIQMKLCSVDRVVELARAIGAPLVSAKDIQRPLNPRGRVFFRRRAISEVFGAQKDKFQEWRWKEWNWVDSNEPSSSADGSLFRHSDQRDLDYYVKYGHEILSTNSETWARWLTTAIRKGEIAKVLQSGEIHFDDEIFQLPFGLSRWWMFFGGGSVSVAANGTLRFVGRHTNHGIGGLDAWIASEASNSTIDTAMARRQLAIELLGRRRNKSFRRGT